MPTFLTGVAAAIALAVICAIGLNAVTESTAAAFYTRYTIPGD
jgi:hypothetical protein